MLPLLFVLQRTKTLRTILRAQFGDRCKGCKAKEDFVLRVQTLLRRKASVAEQRDEL